MSPVKVGDQIPHGTGLSAVLRIFPYTGRYPQWFNAGIERPGTGPLE